MDNFAILAFVDPIGIVTTPSGMEISESQRHGSLCWSLSEWIVYGMTDPISKPAWRYTIGSSPEFWLISSSQNDLFWDPNFTPPCGQLAAPYLYAHREPGPNSKLYTQMKVVGPASHPVSLLALPWPGEPRVGMRPILVILAS